MIRAVRGAADFALNLTISLIPRFRERRILAGSDVFPHMLALSLRLLGDKALKLQLPLVLKTFIPSCRPLDACLSVFNTGNLLIRH